MRFSFDLDRLTRTQPAEAVGTFRYVPTASVSALIHTVHGGAEPRACLTGLRV